MGDFKLNLTNSEKMASKAVDSIEKSFVMRDDLDVDNLIMNEKKAKFNDMVDDYTEELDKQHENIKKAQEEIAKNIDSIEIKPLFNRIMVKPFAYNPFQKLTIDQNGLITDLGGLNPKIEFNRDTGEYQERDQNIIVATVVEVGPECKYIQPGDTVFYLKHLPTPIPFFKQGFWTLKEENVIAVVNEGLSKRF